MADTKTKQGGWLITIGVTIALAAWFIRDAALDDHASDDRVRRMAGAMSGRHLDAQPFDNTPYLIAAAVAALCVLAGVILYASDNGSTSD